MKLKDTIVFKTQDDGNIIAFDLEKEAYYELNDTSTFIFNHIDYSDQTLIEAFINTFTNLESGFEKYVLQHRNEIKEILFDE